MPPVVPIWSNGRVLRRVLALALVVFCATFGALLAPQASSAAPPCVRPAPRVAAERAAVVFTGVVTSATASGTSYVQTVRVDRIYKGQVTSGDQRVRTTGGRCGLGELTPDERYVVMATPDGDSWLAGPRSGTAPASDALLARVQSVLGQGTAPATPAAPPEVDFEQVGSARPTPFLRMAAPGFALVIVGLLGLAAARRWGRAPAEG